MTDIRVPRCLRAAPLAACLATATGFGPTIAAAEFDLAAVQSSPTLAVSNCNDAGPGSLRNAVAAAADGETVDLTTLACSPITLTTGAIHVNVENLTLQGPGAPQLSIEGGASLGHYNRVFEQKTLGIGTLSISGITITDASYEGPTAYGGCIYSTGSISLVASKVENCRVTGGRALGGAIFSSDTVTLVSSTVTNNVAASGQTDAKGGGILAANFNAKYSTVSNNIAESTSHSIGGGIYASFQVRINGSTISGNQAEQAGGISVGDQGDVVVRNSTISNNHASEYIGGADFKPNATISNSTIVFNTSGSPSFGAAGIYARASLAIHSSILANNSVLLGEIESDVAAQVGTVTGEKNLIRATATVLPADTLRGCPRLSDLRDNGGPTLTHMLMQGSLGIDGGKNDLNFQTDQRSTGFQRTFGTATDIGAVEWQGEVDDVLFKSAFELRCD